MSPSALAPAGDPAAREARASVQLRRFRPRLALGYQQELRIVAEQLVGQSPESARSTLGYAIAVVEKHWTALRCSGLTPADLIPTSSYLATLRVLRDLVVQGWTVRTDDEGVILDAPGQATLRLADPEPQKEALRRSFAFARNAQLTQPATEGFIKSMERRGVASLFADGVELADRLTREGSEAIRPELELVENSERDPESGLLLQDIWRYARHYWSIPYQSTPGRNMFYLVRDGVLSSRPLIGIAALGNPVLGLAQRDHFFGWSVPSLRRSLPQMTPQRQRKLAEHLFAVVEKGLEETYTADLWPAGRPTNWRSGVAELEQIEKASAALRLKNLTEAGADRDAEYQLIRKAHSDLESDAEVDWESLALTSLYRRKRAGTLADLLRAHGAFSELGFPSGRGALAAALATEDGVRALEVSLRRIKQQVIASNVMELITCGAVPPYRDVLGGKLVAMLMLSNQVVDDFARRYSGRVSLIGSALAGRPMVRTPRLAALTTSSLYAMGSSQYNRIKIPSGDKAVSYKRVGTTDSFGTVHFAPDTVSDLAQLARLTDNRRQINNLFGEGTSPKLRQVRSGLEALGLQPDYFLRHHSPRLLYAAHLCSNAETVMLGFDSPPKYVLPKSGSTNLIAEHWRGRWLAARANRADILERLRLQTFEKFRLSEDLSALGGAESSERRPVPISGDAPTLRVSDNERATFVERLYRSTNSYADRLNREELESIHVDLGVDAFLLGQVEAGRQVIVTGNPGDGKTHLIGRLQERLEALGALVIPDANASSNEEILDTWLQAREEPRPFVLAINEWPLYVLQRLARERSFTPVDEALRQVTTARFYVDAQKPEPPGDEVVVIDLSLRNLLSPNVVLAVIDRLTQDQFYEDLNPADPMLKNREALREPRVRERLTALLGVVSTRIDHVTMRQLVGFIAFLLSGGQSAAERLREGQDSTGFTYSTLAFEGGVGPLFEAVRSIFDPAAITHPDWDDRLWLGEHDADAWLGQPPPGPLSLSEAERDAAFRAIKRRFFFEHVEGGTLLGLIPLDESEFAQCLTEGEQAKVGLVRDLVLSLNRFYEPDADDRDALHLWQSHRYDVRAPSAFVSLHELSHRQLRVEPSRMAPLVHDWLPAEFQERRSFALVAASGDRADVALLEVDRELFLTLIEAQRGLGRASWSRTATRRITRFIDKIHRATESASTTEDIRIRNVETDLDETFEIQRTPARYRL